MPIITEYGGPAWDIEYRRLDTYDDSPDALSTATVTVVARTPKQVEAAAMRYVNDLNVRGGMQWKFWIEPGTEAKRRE